MGNFNRGSRSGGGRGFERRGFNDRGSRGPVQMHEAVCDKCQKSCEVPFRPTSGKPVFCNDCFKSNGDFNTRRPEGRNFEEKRMFEAVCDECKNSCKVPFMPSGEKPVYCSDCFGEKKGAGDRNGASEFQHKELFESLNIKLDRIIAMLTPDTFAQPIAVVEDKITEEIVEDETKAAKKKPSKKK